MWFRAYLTHLVLAALAVALCLFEPSGRWPWLDGLAGVAAVAVLAVPLTLWGLRPGQRLLEAIMHLDPAEVERLAAHRGPAGLRRLIDCLVELAGARQANAFFLADVAHQLRTDLQLLRIRLDRLGVHVSEYGVECYERALADIDRLHRTLTEQLEFAQLVEGRPPMELDAAEIVRGRVRAWNDAAEMRGLTISSRTSGECRIFTRNGVLEQILDILLDNSLKHSPRAGVVRVEILPSGGHTVVRVLDEGPSMTPEEREQATIRRWRGHGESGEGRGLGLAIANMLMVSNGGTLTLDAGPGGRGVDARCRFPSAPAAPD
ncbi:sensor histidine kinase [Actinomadura rayongensis]|uniref:histidine kinase n=1 Tax=Actinomadura rayongensis TaxID=1429076 RepID=A0A6I4W790_9ACTN|nr:HAMP domain-containing sensor histidine kinase [Actinomadura rayongensis]MXQ63014.1 hypothetical protein [Actinomadura rayongensis]